MGMALVAMAALAGGADAQQRRVPPAGHVGIAAVGAGPLGDLGHYIDAGGGAQLYGAVPLDPEGRVRLRMDFGFLIYGHERRSLCYAVPVGCRIEADLTTTNSVLYGGLGPEVVLATGDVQPYLNASAGFSYFLTTSSLSDAWGYGDYATTTNYTDAVFAWRAGGGIRVQVSGGRAPVFMDLGVERHQNGVAYFLTQGDIEDHPNGDITLYPNRSEANMVAFRLGVSVGIPRSRPAH
jgi:hypothetical protein